MAKRGFSRDHELTQQVIKQFEEELHKGGNKDYKSEKIETCSQTVSDPEDCLPFVNIQQDDSYFASELRDRVLSPAPIAEHNVAPIDLKKLKSG